MKDNFANEGSLTSFGSLKGHQHFKADICTLKKKKKKKKNLKKNTIFLLLREIDIFL
jgi:type IV secretory pathway TrbF-like protein